MAKETTVPFYPTPPAPPRNDDYSSVEGAEWFAHHLAERVGRADEKGPRAGRLGLTLTAEQMLAVAEAMNRYAGQLRNQARGRSNGRARFRDYQEACLRRLQAGEYIGAELVQMLEADGVDLQAGTS